MSDNLQNPNAALSEQAKALEKAQDYAGASEIFKQMYMEWPKNSFAASRYIRCLRKLNKSQEAFKFGWSLSDELRANPHVHRAWAWTIYDIYFKASEQKENIETDFDEPSHQNDDSFKKMQNAANYILDRTPQTEMLLRTRIVLGICREAKLRGNWPLVYKFASQLDPTQIEKKPYLQNRMSDLEQWFYNIIKASFNLNKNEECQTTALRGIEEYPQNIHFRWWKAVSKANMGSQEEALKELQELDRQKQEWFIREDIATIFEQLQRYDKAWIWYCKAAAQQGPIQGRYKMIGHMSTLLIQLQRYQEAYEHVQLAHLLAEKGEWGKSKSAQELKEQMGNIQKQYATQITPQVHTLQDLYTLQKKLQNIWKDEIAETLPHRQGYIKTVNAERKFGFIHSAPDDFHFSFRDLPYKMTPTLYMQVEFDVEESYDYKKQKESVKAVHIHPL